MSSFMFSRSRHLSAVLGGGAARRPAWACMGPEAVVINIRTGSQRWIFMKLILTTIDGIQPHLANPGFHPSGEKRACRVSPAWRGPGIATESRPEKILTADWRG